MEEPGGKLRYAGKTFRLAAGFAVPVRIRYGDVEAAGDVPNRFHEGNVLVFHEKGEYAASFVASETVEDLAFRIDAEGRGLLVVERTQPQVIFAGFPQRDVVGNDVHDVRLRPDRIDEVVRYTRQGSLPVHARRFRLRPHVPYTRSQASGGIQCASRFSHFTLQPMGLVSGVRTVLPAVMSFSASSRSLTFISSVSFGLSTPRPV